MLRTYIHSHVADFAKTEVLSEGAYLGRGLRKGIGQLRIFGCGCETRALVRIYRKFWMRLVFPLMRHYRCTQCGARIVRTPVPRKKVYYYARY